MADEIIKKDFANEMNEMEMTKQICKTFNVGPNSCACLDAI